MKQMKGFFTSYFREFLENLNEITFNKKAPFNSIPFDRFTLREKEIGFHRHVIRSVGMCSLDAYPLGSPP